MTMQVDDFKKLVETLDLPEDVKNKVFEATKDENEVPYEWEDETHLGAEVEDDSGNKFILYSIDDGVDFNGVAVNNDGRPFRNCSRYVSRKGENKFTGRKAILVDTKVPDSADDVEVGEVFAARYNGEDVIARRVSGINFVWAVLTLGGGNLLKPDKDVELLHRLVEAK